MSEDMPYTLEKAHLPLGMIKLGHISLSNYRKETQLYLSEQLKCEGDIKTLKNKGNFFQWLDDLYQKEWVVYSKAPFNSAEYVLGYLGRYTHSVGISNYRIKEVKGQKITFQWKDSKEKNKNKLMTLEAAEFIRRFLMHILPHKFVKIRHYGILSNRNRKTKLKICKKRIGSVFKYRKKELKKKSASEILLLLTGVDLQQCPCCKKGKMVSAEKILGQKLCPT